MQAIFEVTTWFEALPEADERCRVTVRLVRSVQRQALTRTFVSLAAETGLDEKSVRNWFHHSITELERITPGLTPQTGPVNSSTPAMLG
jgi:transposase